MNERVANRMSNEPADEEEEDLARRLRALNRRLQGQLNDFDELALEEIDEMLQPEPTTTINGLDIDANFRNVVPTNR